MGELLSLLFEMREILSLLPLFSTKSLKNNFIADILSLLGEVCEIISLRGLERGLRAHGRSFSAHGRNPGV